MDRDDLARSFATGFDLDPGRGYGPMALEVLDEIRAGVPWREAAGSDPDDSLLRVAHDHYPAGPTRDGIAAALDLPPGAPVADAVRRLGNGSRVLAEDTVPLALWCAARHLDSFEDAMWATLSALGDRDTTCAIVGAVVALAVGREGIPEEWRSSRESLDDYLALV